jgi:hypothetical protein
MPLPVITNTFRVALNWADVGSSGQHAVNVIHFSTATGTVAQLGAALDLHLLPNMFYGTSSSWVLGSADILPLDGVSAGTHYTFTLGPHTGGTAGAWVPAVSALVSFHTPTRGPAGRGRVYCPAIVEGIINDGLYDPSAITPQTTAWNTFQGAMHSSTGGWDLVVASYAHANAELVTNIQTRSVLATQRRRQDRLR